MSATFNDVCAQCGVTISEEDRQLYDDCECEDSQTYCTWDCFYATHSSVVALPIPETGHSIEMPAGCGYSTGDQFMAELMIDILREENGL